MDSHDRVHHLLEQEEVLSAGSMREVRTLACIQNAPDTMGMVMLVDWSRSASHLMWQEHCRGLPDRDLESEKASHSCVCLYSSRLCMTET